MGDYNTWFPNKTSGASEAIEASWNFVTRPTITVGVVDVQVATLDDFATVTSLAATAITYDNTTSGLTATNAQAAIDELSPALGYGTATGTSFTGTVGDITETDTNVSTAIKALDAYSRALTAAQVTFDATGTSLTATDVQAAIVEMDGAYATQTWVGDQLTNYPTTAGSHILGGDWSWTTGDGTGSTYLGLPDSNSIVTPATGAGAVRYNASVNEFQGYDSNGTWVNLGLGNSTGMSSDWTFVTADANLEVGKKYLVDMTAGNIVY